MEGSVKLIPNSSRGQLQHLYHQRVCSPNGWPRICPCRCASKLAEELLPAAPTVCVCVCLSFSFLPTAGPRGALPRPHKVRSLTSGLCEFLHSMEGICRLKNIAVFEPVLEVLSRAGGFILHGGLFFKAEQKIYQGTLAV